MTAKTPKEAPEPRAPETAQPAQARPDAPRPFCDLHDLWRRSGLSRASLERLAAADAFRSLGLDRRRALWELRGLPETKALPLFDHADAREMGEEPQAPLPEMPLSEHVVNDYRTMRLSLKAHPMQFLRPALNAEWLASCATLKQNRNGSPIHIAGLVLVRQRPGSSRGVVFMTLEDETGIANAVIWPKTFEAYRPVVMGARLIVIHGRIQRHEDIIHIVAERLEDRSDWLSRLSEDGLQADLHANALLANADEVRRPEPGSWRPERQKPRDEPGLALPIAHGDHVHHPGHDPRDEDLRHDNTIDPDPRNRPHPRWRPKHPRAERIIPKSRDFH